MRQDGQQRLGKYFGSRLGPSVIFGAGLAAALNSLALGVGLGIVLALVAKRARTS